VAVIQRGVAATLCIHLQKGNTVTPPAKRNTPPVKRNSLDQILGRAKDDDVKEEESKSVNADNSVSGPVEESDQEDADKNREVDPVTMDDVESSLSSSDHKGPDPDEEDETDEAPGDGIISEEDHEDTDEVQHRRDVALTKEGVLSRVHKMSPAGMTILNTYSGGSEKIDHGVQDVVIKSLPEGDVKRTREISDETGKSRLLHPDITKPYVPSEQAMVTETVTRHEYATPYDPENDPNNRR
jgi:hypothetical protein